MSLAAIDTIFFSLENSELGFSGGLALKDIQSKSIQLDDLDESTGSIGKQLQTLFAEYDSEFPDTVRRLVLEFDMDIYNSTELRSYLIKAINETKCDLRDWNVEGEVYGQTKFQARIFNANPTMIFGAIIAAIQKNSETITDKAQSLEFSAIEGIEKLHAAVLHYSN